MASRKNKNRNKNFILGGSRFRFWFRERIKTGIKISITANVVIEIFILTIMKTKVQIYEDTCEVAYTTQKDNEFEREPSLPVILPGHSESTFCSSGTKVTD